MAAADALIVRPRARYIATDSAATKGFSVTDSALSLPLRMKFEQCMAINKKFPDTLAIGFLCEGGIDPAERDICAVNCSVVGTVEDFQGIVVK